MEPEIERVLCMSDEEILAEVRAQGLDPDEEARKMAAQFNVIAGLVKKNEKLSLLLGNAWMRNVGHSRENKRLRGIIERAASYLPGNPDQAERILSEI